MAAKKFTITHYISKEWLEIGYHHQADLAKHFPQKYRLNKRSIIQLIKDMAYSYGCLHFDYYWEQQGTTEKEIEKIRQATQKMFPEFY